MLTSTNLGLNIPEGSDIFNHDTFLKQNFQKIDNMLKPAAVENFTATEGQTVFTTGHTYVLGNSEVSVEVDGVPQSLGSGFTETTTTSVTLSEGVPAGTKVKVIFHGTLPAQDNRLDAVTTQLSGIVNVKQYDVVGDGIVGDSDTLQALINEGRQKAIDTSFKQQYAVMIPSGKYILDKQVTMSPYIKLKPLGNVEFCVTFNGTGLWIAPQATDPTFSLASSLHLNKNSWNRGKYIDGSNGAIVFTTTVDMTNPATVTVALEIGARSSSMNSGLPTSRYVIDNVNIFGFDTAVKLNSVNNYIGTFKHCHWEYNNHHLVIGATGITKINSGENFVFENCVMAQAKKEGFLINDPGFDLSFNNTSFDFNASPVFRSLESGTSIRMNNCYLEMIGDGVGEQIFYRSEAKSTGSTGGRNTLYLSNFIVYTKKPNKFIENLPNATNSQYINLYVDINGLELRYENTTRLLPYNTSERFLIDSPSVTVLGKKILNGSLLKSLVSPTVNMLSNGDFAQSTISLDLTLNTDPYWSVSKSNISNPTIVAEGTNGTNCVKYTITNTSSNYVTMKHKFSYPVTAGDIIYFSTLVKSDGFVPGTSSIVYYLECYDANGTLVTTKAYYDSRFTELTTADGTKFILPRDVGTLIVPNGITSVKPKFDVVNISGTFLSIDDVHIFKSK